MFNDEPKDDTQVSASPAMIVLALIVAIGGYWYTHQGDHVKPADDDNIVVGTLTPGERAALLYVAEYCENMDEAFLINAAKLSDEESITAFHADLSAATKDARTTAAAADGSIDQTLEAANNESPEKLKTRATEVGGGFRAGAVALRKLLDNE